MATNHHCLAMFVLVAGCDSTHAAVPPPAVPIASPHVAIPGFPALPDEAPAVVASPVDVVVPLAVPGFGRAAVYVPRGTGARVVIVAAHGNYDRPEWQCDVWRALVAGRAFILCPRGVSRIDSPSMDDIRFTYDTQASMGREIDAGLAALRLAYGARVSTGPIVYTGFSLGAIYGVGYLRETRERVSGAVLVEGGHSLWTDGAIRAFADRGGAAVVFACGQAWCARDARRVQPRFRAPHIETDVTFAPGSGHSYGGAVARALQPAFERLIAPLLQAPAAGP